MNKKILVCSALAVMGVSFGAQAAFVGPTNVDVVTVEQAKNMSDDAKVILRGNIESSLGGEHYMFKDSTGSIRVEIDDEDWHGLNVTPKDKVEIQGEVDTHMMKPTDIDVDSIKLVK